jgi:putative inorganic carbon (HCO3(-)) transporter
MTTSAATARLDGPQLRAVLLFTVLAGAVAALVVANPEFASGISGASAPLLLTSALVIGALTIRYSAIGLPLLVAFVFLNVSEALVRYHDFPSLLQLLVVGLVFAAWLKHDTDAVTAVATQPLTVALLAYLALVTVSTIWARDGAVADARLVDLLKAATVFALATALMNSRERIVHGLTTMVVAASAVSALVIFQMAAGLHHNPLFGLARVKAHAHVAGTVFAARAAGPIGDPNYFGQSLLLAVPLCAVFAARSNSRPRRMLWIGAGVLQLIAIGLTYSRGSIIAIPIVGLLSALVLRLNWRVIALAAVAAALIASPFMSGAFFNRLMTISMFLPTDEQSFQRDSSFEERRLFMRVAWEMFSDRPALGVGLGNYGVAYEDYSGRVASTFRALDDLSEVHFAHNLFLEVAAETGTPGLLLLLIVFAVCWIRLAQNRKAFSGRGDEFMRTISGALQIALLGFAFTSLFLHLELPRHLFLLFAFAAAVDRLAGRGGAENSLSLSDSP